MSDSGVRARAEALIEHIDTTKATSLEQYSVAVARALLVALDQIDAALALHVGMHDGVADELGLQPYPGDICAVCYYSMPCLTVRALGGEST